MEGEKEIAIKIRDAAHAVEPPLIYMYIKTIK